MPHPGGPHLEANDIPLANHEIAPPIAPSMSRDEALHGGADDEESTLANPTIPAEANPIPPSVEATPPAVELPPVPGQPNILKKVQFMVASALGAHEKKVTSRNAFGKEVTHVVKSKDVYTIEQADFANRRMTESKDKWDPSSIEGLNGFQRFGKKIEVGLSRIWRGTLAEDAHRKKEIALGIELSKISGIDTAVSEEFYSVIEQKARARIKDERKTGTQKFLGGVSDAWAEFTATNSKLHKYEMEEARELRRKYDSNPANSDPVENPLFALVNRDVATRESFAARMNESSLDLLKQTNPGDKKTTVAIRLDGPQGEKVQTYLKNEILKNIITDFTTRLDANENVTGISAKLRRESDVKLQNYFMTNEFQDWVKTLPADQQALFENSFTYATDLLLQTEEGLLPAVKESLEHYKSADMLNFDIELSLGTGQLGANTEVTKDGWFTKERASMNKKLMDQMRGERNTSPESRLYDTDVIHGGMVKDRMMGYATSIVKSEALWAWASAVTVKGVSMAARKYSELAPSITAGLVAGTLTGLKQWARMDEMRATRGFGVANGLEFPVAANAVKSAELASADYNRIQLSDRTQQLVESITRFKAGTADVNTAFMAMVYDADSTARLKLNGERNINLLTASVAGPEGRGIYMRELRQLDQARAMNSVMLETFLADESKRNELADLIGIPADQTRDARAMMNRLVDAQYQNLLSGTKIDGALSAKLSTLDAKLVIDQSESIRARDKIYNGMHIRSTAKYAATSGALAGVMSWGLGKYFNHEAEITNSGHEEVTYATVDHARPLVEDKLPTAIITHHDGSVLAQTYSHVPEGTHLELVSERVGGPDDLIPSYNLVMNSNPDKVLINGINFGHSGEITNLVEIQDDMLANHINLDTVALEPVISEVAAPDSLPEASGELITQTQNLRVGDLEGYNEQGWSGWFHHTMSADGSAPRNPELNAVLKTFRGFEIWEKNGSNVAIVEEPGIPHRVIHYKDLADELFGGRTDVVAAPQASNAVFSDIPNLWATPEGHEAIATVFDEAESTFKLDGTFVDEAHRIIYEAGIGGESGIPDAAEMKVLLEYFGNMSGDIPSAEVPEVVSTTITPVENWFTLTADYTEAIPVPPDQLYTTTVADGWTHLAALGYIHPLERSMIDMGIPSRGIEGFYYGTGSLESMRKWLRNHPESKKPYKKLILDGQEMWLDVNGNEVSRSIDREKEQLTKYLESIKISNPDYYNQLEQLANTTTMKSMSGTNRVSVNIPAYMEEKNLYNLLTEYVHQVDANGQPLSPDLFEINILVNRKRGMAPDASVAEIQKFISEQSASGRNFNINYVDIEFDPPYNNVGNARKVITDLTLMRSLKRSNQNGALYIESEDADLLKVDSKTVINAISILDANPHLDAVRGIQDRMPDVMQNNDYLFTKRRLWDFMELALRRKKYRIENNPKWSHFWNRVITGGWNTAYTAEAYAMIDGYDPLQGAGGEDVAIGEKITIARGDGNTPNLDVIGKTPSRSDSSPRRFINEILTGRGAYEDFANEIDDKNIRSSSLEDLMASIEPVSRVNATSEHHFIDLLQGHYSVVKELTPNEAEAEKLFKDLMLWIGLKNTDYSMVNGEVKVTNLSNLQKALEDYRTRHTGTRKIGERVKNANPAPPPVPPTP